MARPYFTLCEFDGAWSPQFGDYSRRTVNEERRDMIEHYRLVGFASLGFGIGDRAYSKRLKVIRTGDTQAEINAGVLALNEPLGRCEHG